MEAIKAHFRNDRFATRNGMEIVELAAGYCRAQMRVREEHLNSVGVVHGGAMFTLADLAFAGACNSAGQMSLGVSMTIQCVAAVSGGTLTAEAREVARSRKISTCLVEVRDDGGTLVASFQGMAYVKAERFPPLPRGDAAASQ